MDRDSLGLIVAAMSLPNVLARLGPDVTVIAPSDRTDLIPGLMLAHQSGTFPTLAGIILTGGYPIPETIARLSAGVQQDLPIALTDDGTFRTAERLMQVRGPMTKDSRNKIETARRLFSESVDQAALLAAIDVSASEVRTPLMFEYQLMERARSDRKHIVLPESQDDRILEAADDPAAPRRRRPDPARRRDEGAGPRLGPRARPRRRARSSRPPTRSSWSASRRSTPRARAHKGMTVERAREVVTDVSYFGTMMVHLGLADGMVSGAVNTTAHTIRPALEFVKTGPGRQRSCRASSSCAWPTGCSSTATAPSSPTRPPSSSPTSRSPRRRPPRSSASSRGWRCSPTRPATSGSRRRGREGPGGDGAGAPSARRTCALEGPIQYDAAVDPAWPRTKLPGLATVAGRATVFVFPDLNTGNNTYKAVQRSAHAVAIGPVLQGLRKPVNDLSRGALVDDIVNTVAITAVQAQGTRSSRETGR